MCCIQMMIVTGGYDGSQDVASTEVINLSGEKYLTCQDQGGEMVLLTILDNLTIFAKTKVERWCGGTLGSFHRREVDSVEPMWPESFMWLEVKTQDISITIPPNPATYNIAAITTQWHQVWTKTMITCKKFFCGTR